MLEQQVHSQLFDRIGRQISLTESGRTQLPHAEAVLREMQSARQAISDLAGKAFFELLCQQNRA